MPTLINAITANPGIRAFKRVAAEDQDEEWNWEYEPVPCEVVTDPDRGGYYVLGALHILPSLEVRACFIDMCLPERISSYVYYVEGREIRRGYKRKLKEKIIPAIAIDCHGDYDLFYSKSVPELGIEILKRGLAASARKYNIARDLGYIFRDEKRYREAAEMFQIVVDEGPPSVFMYAELAQAYEKIGHVEQQKKYDELADRIERNRHR
jgi:tetratricopeptide (TPR) repeat protein